MHLAPYVWLEGRMASPAGSALRFLSIFLFLQSKVLCTDFTASPCFWLSFLPPPRFFSSPSLTHFLPGVEHFLLFQDLGGVGWERGLWATSPFVTALSCSDSAIFRRGTALQGDSIWFLAGVSRTEHSSWVSSSRGRAKSFLLVVCISLFLFWVWSWGIRNTKRSRQPNVNQLHCSKGGKAKWAHHTQNTIVLRALGEMSGYFRLNRFLK